MGPTIKFYSEDFRREFRERVKRSNSTIAELVNEAAFQIMREWQKLIPKADRTQIEALGITYRTTNKKGTRALKRKIAVYSPTSAFKLITLKNLWKFGPSPRSLASAAALDDLVRRKLARRNSSVGFVASGPVPAMRALLRKIHSGGMTGAENKVYPGTKGSARPAIEGTWSPFAEIRNATGMNGPNQDETSRGRVFNKLMETYHKAVGNVTAEWHQYACRRLERTLHGD